MHPPLLAVEPPIVPVDVARRARRILEEFPSFGSYSESKGGRTVSACPKALKQGLKSYAATRHSGLHDATSFRHTTKT